jgi:chromate transport protein ChrA
MKLSAPKKITFYIAVGLALIGFIGFFVASMATIAPWLVLAGFVVLAAGNMLENL